MESINNNQNNDNEKKESKKTKIFSTICSTIYSGIVIVGYIMVICLGFTLFGVTIAFCFTYLL